MPNLKLQQIISDLSRFGNVTTREDLALNGIAPTGSSTNPKSANIDTPESQLAHLLVSTVDGGFTTDQIISKLKDFAGGRGSFGHESLLTESLIKKNVMIVSDGAVGFLDQKVGSSDMVGSDFPLKFSGIVVKRITLTPAVRDVEAVSLFMNMVPTLEMSRCVPFLNVQVTVGRPPLSSDGRLQSMSLLRFLAGSAPVDATSADQKLAAAMETTISNGSQALGAAQSGLEMFTSPQVLVDPNPTNDSFRASPVIDRFRPFMSIESLKVDVTPGPGFFAYRSAEMAITLHDRSRLAEVADLVQPDLYKSTELLIEYGWSHPDTTGTNIFGDLINAMRAREKYGIVNSSFAFTKMGEVKIKLKLATKGASDIRIVKIGDDAKIVAAAEAIKAIQQKIGELHAKQSTQKGPGVPEVRGEQVLFAAAEDTSSNLVLTIEQSKELFSLRRQVKHGRGSPDFKEIQKLLDKLFGQNGKQGKALDFKQKIASTIKDKVESFLTTKDPFISDALALRTKGGKAVPKFVSLGKLLMAFIGQPLAWSDKYSDVQLIFYPFNGKAGLMSDKNISEFRIDIINFKKALTAIATARRGVNIPLRDFITFVANYFIDDMASENYGFKDYYTVTWDPVTGLPKTDISKRYKDKETELNRALEQRFQKLDSQDGIFKMPMLDVIIETVPGAAANDTDSIAEARLDTILRIHLFDRVATQYESLGQLLLASRAEDLRTVGKLAAKESDQCGHVERFNAVIAAAIKANLIEKVDGADDQTPVYRPTKRVTELRSFLRQYVPTIIYGCQNTNIKDGHFATIQDALLSTVHMLRAGESGEMSPTGLSQGNLPLRTLPARADIVSAGCPLIHFMQQFFVDFGTNTTIDNIYGVNKLSHEITPSKFESRWEMVPLDAYGQYTNLLHQVDAARTALTDIQKQGTQSRRGQR